MTFSEWVLTQTDRSDPVGDLACDFRDDPERGRIATPLGLRRHLNALGVCQGAHDALTRAMAEYEQAAG